MENRLNVKLLLFDYKFDIASLLNPLYLFQNGTVIANKCFKGVKGQILFCLKKLC